MRKYVFYIFLLSLLVSNPLCMHAQEGEQKKHLSFYDTFFGNEEDYQVCYPKDHRNFFYSIIVSSAAALFLLGFIIYFKTKNNKLLKGKNDTIQQKNQELLDSIMYARRIQNALLPDKDLLDRLASTCRVIYKPRDIVSGDFYWVYEDAQSQFFAVIDCTGHGVPGAFLSLLAHNAINKAVIELNLQHPAEILHCMNDYVKTALKQSSGQEIRDGMEVGLCIVDKVSRSVEYAGANIKLYYSQHGQLTEIKGAKCSVGSVQPHVESIPVNHLLSLGKGNRLFMHTDGIVDQFGGEHSKKFSTKKLKQLLEESLSLPMQEQAQRVEQNFERWKGALEQTDDVLFLMIEL